MPLFTDKNIYLNGLLLKNKKVLVLGIKWLYFTGCESLLKI